MAYLEKEKDSIELNVICPICKRTFKLYMGEKQLKKTTGVLHYTDIRKSPCNHSFGIFIDINGKVRGYQKTDSTIEFVGNSDLIQKSELIIEKEMKLFQKIKHFLPEEIFFKSLHNCLINEKIYCITDMKFLRDNFEKFLKDIFGSLTPKITICSLSEFNNNIRFEVYASKNRNALVFNADFSSIIKESYNTKFDKNEFEFIYFLLKLVEGKGYSDNEITELFKKTIKNVFTELEVLKNEIEKGKIRKEIEFYNKFKGTFSNNIEIKGDTLNDIMKNHFNFDSKKFFEQHRLNNGLLF